MTNIILIEFHSCHEEVIIPQLEFLKKTEYKVHLFINENVKEKKINIDNISVKFIPNNKISKILYILKIIQFIYTNQIDIVIINTLENKYVKLLNIFIPRKVKKIGILHNLDRFEEDRLNFKNFLVLSDNVLENAKKIYSEKYNFGSFYPIIDSTSKEEKLKISDKIKIVIPGLVEFSRRDYMGLLDILKKEVPRNIQFIILGDISKLDGPKVKDKIIKENLKSIIKIYEGFISYDKYFYILKNADMIMPLIHPNVENFEKYHTTKITAAFTMGFSFKIPFFLYYTLSNLEEFKKFAIPYNLYNISEVFNSLNVKNINKLKKVLKKDKNFTLKYQQNKYTNYLENLL